MSSLYRSSLYRFDKFSQWDLGDDWVEQIRNPPYKPIPIRSNNYSGFLCRVSRDIGGDVIRDSETGTLILLGCFVGLEMRPRFLGTVSLVGNFVLFTAHGILYHPIALSNKSFDSNLGGLKTLLWRI